MLDGSELIQGKNLADHFAKEEREGPYKFNYYYFPGAGAYGLQVCERLALEGQASERFHVASHGHFDSQQNLTVG